MLAVLVLTVVLSFQGVQAAFHSSIALEQTARCGLTEHVHTAQCYDELGLCCAQTEHVHNRNCYLLLLQDNDINGLLTKVEQASGNSLEGLLDDVVTTAASYQSTAQSQQAQTVLLSAGTEEISTQTAALTVDTLEAEDIAQLNQTIQEAELQPSVVLNENLYKTTAAAELQPTDTQEDDTGQTSAVLLAADTDDSGVSLLSVGDEAQDGNYNANFYVYLDGEWTGIGTMTFTVSGRRNNYSATLNTASMLTFINDALDGPLSPTLTSDDFLLYYAASELSTNWQAATTSGSSTVLGTARNTSSLQGAKYIQLRSPDNYYSPLEFYTVTLIYPDGTASVSYVPKGVQVTLPSGYTWTNDQGTVYGDGTAVITRKTTFTAFTDGKLRVYYDVAFPTVSSVTVSSEPTLLGTASQQLTDVIEEDGAHTLRSVSQQEVKGKDQNYTDIDLSRVIRFSGWRVGDSDVILSANSTLSWEELQQYAVNSRVELYGVWEYAQHQTASFFVRFDSVAVDTEGNMTGGSSTDYTKELFATFVGGADAASGSYTKDELTEMYGIADTTSDNSYQADQRIRALYGEQSGIWLQSFPDDAYIFEQLKQYADYLEVDGEPVAVEDLHSDAYVIRWYVFKCQNDAWHVDGKLVKKVGLIHVSKTFAGNKQAVAQIKEGFTIDAYDRDEDRHLTLGLEEGGADLAPVSYDETTNTYVWEIEDVEYGEWWDIKEYPGTMDDTDCSVYSEYRVVDITNSQNATGQGTSVSVSGMTFAPDTGTRQVLQVQFTNICHTSDSIIIKKEDQRTGAAIGGAVFQLVQNDQPLSFRYDETAEQYVYDEEGELTELSRSASGYYEIVTSGFTYDLGDVTVQELTAPAGYTPIENVVLGYQTDPDTGQTAVAILSDSPLARYQNGLLIIGNSSDSTTVTAVKQWDCPEDQWQDVTVQLLANGELVSTLIPGVEANAQLTAGGGWKHTWTNLPVYANGSEIVWSVREVRIGSESCRVNYTFANWIVTYDSAVYTRDTQGKVTNASFTIRNDTRRTMLRLTKYDRNGSVRLSGASFRLQYQVADGSGGYVDDTSFSARSLTTGSDGTLVFENLLYGRYELVETVAPSGYVLCVDPIYLTIQEDGSVTVDAHAYAQAGSSAYNIAVYNQAQHPLPSSGGPGTAGYYTLGALFMLCALGVYILPKKPRKGRDQAAE